MTGSAARRGQDRLLVWGAGLWRVKVTLWGLSLLLRGCGVVQGRGVLVGRGGGQGRIGLTWLPHTARGCATLLHDLLVLGAAVLEPNLHLSLCESERSGKFGSFRQRQILRSLEPPVELLELQTGVNSSRLPHLLPFTVDPQLFLHLTLVVSGWRGGLVCRHGEMGGGSAVATRPHRVHAKRVPEGSASVLRGREHPIVLMMVLGWVAGADAPVGRVGHSGWHLLLLQVHEGRLAYHLLLQTVHPAQHA